MASLIKRCEKMTYTTTAVKDLLYLLNCALNNHKPDFARVSKMDLTEIFSLAQSHNIAACASFALDNIGLDKESMLPWEQVQIMSIRRSILLDMERNKIYSYMNNNSIWHISLKGIVMQSYYPQFGMREMCDNDILYDSSYQKQMYDFMISCGYQAEIYQRSNHDEYVKPPMYNFELHNTLFMRSENEILFEYYSDIMDKLKPIDGKKYELCFSNEDFYIYNTAHAYKHYVSEGTGLRILADCYVYLLKQSNVLDFDYIESECENLGIADYERNCRSLSQKLFSPDSEILMDKINLTKAEQELIDNLINSGTYGKPDLGIEKVLNGIAEDNGNIKSVKIKYYFRRIFVPLEFIKDIYPFFYRHKILIPCLWVYRIVRAITMGRGKLKAELKSVDNTIEKLKSKS